MPEKPEVYPVKFISKDNGLFLSETNAINLSRNMDEIDAYILKLETLIDTMNEYYNTK